MEPLEKRVERLEQLVVQLISDKPSSTPNEWVDSQTFMELAGLRNKYHVYDLLAEGVFKDGVKNIGTSKRPRYRFHRTHALEYLLNRGFKSPNS